MPARHYLVTNHALDVAQAVAKDVIPRGQAVRQVSVRNLTGVIALQIGDGEPFNIRIGESIKFDPPVTAGIKISWAAQAGLVAQLMILGPESPAMVSPQS